jgi:AcrR family transcriptional regulator
MVEAVALPARWQVRFRAGGNEGIADAVRLAAAHGVDNVTVEAIADAATISRRTFSKYFATEEWLAEPAAGDRRTTDRYRELRRHPALLAEQVATYAAAERELTSAIAQRIPAGPNATLRARLLAANFLSTLRVAHQLWLDPPAHALPRLVREALTLTAESFS